MSVLVKQISFPTSAGSKYDFAALAAAADRNQAITEPAGDDPAKTRAKVQAAVNNFRKKHPELVANVTFSVKAVTHQGEDLIAVWAVPKTVAPAPQEAGHPIADSKTNAASAV